MGFTHYKRRLQTAIAGIMIAIAILGAGVEVATAQQVVPNTWVTEVQLYCFTRAELLYGVTLYRNGVIVGQSGAMGCRSNTHVNRYVLTPTGGIWGEPNEYRFVVRLLTGFGLFVRSCTFSGTLPSGNKACGPFLGLAAALKISTPVAEYCTGYPGYPGPGWVAVASEYCIPQQ